MRGKRFMRAALVAAAMSVALAGSTTQAAITDSPCASDPGLCAPVSSPSALAGCNAIAVHINDGTSQTSYAKSAVTANAVDKAEHANASYLRGDLPPILRAQGLASHCQAEVGTTKLACGSARLGDFRLDLRPLGHPLYISGTVGEERGCSNSQVGFDHNTATYERLEILVGSQCAPTTPVTCTPAQALYPQMNEQPNRAIVLSDDAYLILNEQRTSTSGCQQNQGSLLRLVSGDLQVILGWVSTGACA